MVLTVLPRYIRTGTGSSTPLAVAKARGGSGGNPLGALYVRTDLHGVLWTKTVFKLLFVPQFSLVVAHFTKDRMKKIRI